MRQVWQERVGDPRQVMAIREVEPRPPRPGEVRVRLEAAPILPMDALRARGLYPLAQDLPGVPGSAGVGRVVAGDPDWVGARVHLPVRSGTWAEEVTAPVEGCLPVPDGVHPVTAACLRIDGMSAVDLLSGLTGGAWVLVNAATGGVGHLAVQVARRMGLRVAAVARRADRLEWARGLGADVVLLDGPDLPERVRAEVGAPIHRALDGVGGEATERLGASLAEGGRVLHYGAASRQGPRLRTADVVFRGVLLQGYWLAKADVRREPGEGASILAKLCALDLTCAVDSTFPLASLPAALERHAHPDRFGRVVLTMNGTVA